MLKNSEGAEELQSDLGGVSGHCYNYLFKKAFQVPGMVMPACNPSTWEDETEDL